MVLGFCYSLVPHYMYVEYLENGNLQDYLIKNYQPRRRTILQNPGQILPNGLRHPVLFAKDVANALEFLHQNEVFIDFNLQLITEYRITKSRTEQKI